MGIPQERLSLYWDGALVILASGHVCSMARGSLVHTFPAELYNLAASTTEMEW